MSMVLEMQVFLLLTYFTPPHTVSSIHLSEFSLTPISFCQSICVCVCCLIGCTYLFLSSSLLHPSAKWLGSRVARRAGHTVVSRICVLTAVHTIKLKASIWDFFALFLRWKEQLLRLLSWRFDRCFKKHKFMFVADKRKKDQRKVFYLPHQHLYIWYHCRCSQLGTFHTSRSHQGNWCTWIQQNRGSIGIHLINSNSG